jgi:site-specific recombinase XerD
MGSNDAQLFAQTRTLRIRQRHSFDFSSEFSTSRLQAVAILTRSDFHEVSRAEGPQGQRRNYAQNTTRSYLRTVEEFARRFNCPPDRLGPRHIREYQAELFEQRKLSADTVAQRLAALRFFYSKTLKKSWSIAETPYPKRAQRLPTILSQEEVAQLIDAASTPFHRTVLMTLYSTGARNAELTHLKVARGAKTET